MCAFRLNFLDVLIWMDEFFVVFDFAATNVVVTAVKYDQDAADTDAVFQNMHVNVM